MQTQLFPLLHLVSCAISLESTEHGVDNSHCFGTKSVTYENDLVKNKLTTQFSQSFGSIGKLLKCSSILETQKRVQFIICTNQLAVGYSGNIVCISVYCVNFPSAGRNYDPIIPTCSRGGACMMVEIKHTLLWSSFLASRSCGRGLFRFQQQQLAWFA